MILMTTIYQGQYCHTFHFYDEENKMMCDSLTNKNYYLRIHTDDEPGVLADITRILAEQKISIEAILQKEPEDNNGIVPVIMLTQKVVEKNMDLAIKDIEALKTVKDSVMRIRMESLD